MKILLSFCLYLITFSAYSSPTTVGDITFSNEEKAIIESLSSRQYSQKKDATNIVSGNADAIEFGKRLFFDKGLSGDGKFSCASCHNPAMGWANHKDITKIRAGHNVNRHVPSLWGVRYNRWYFWDGRADSLWSQALMPIENEAEMAGNRLQVIQWIINTPDLRASYQKIFGRIPETLLNEKLPLKARPVRDNKAHPENQAWNTIPEATRLDVNYFFANIGKVIASFEETIVSKQSPFDRFADQLRKKSSILESSISPSATRGLKLFIGKAGCVNCHFGANFSDGEFHHSFLQKISLNGDLGRYDGVTKLLNNPFNAKSIFNDAGQNSHQNKLDYVYKNVEFRGQFKTPSLRNVEKTYPYMHTGEFKTLEDVIGYYNTVSSRIPPNAHQEVLLKSLHLSAQDQIDLVEFLKSLTDESTTGDIL